MLKLLALGLSVYARLTDFLGKSIIDGTDADSTRPDSSLRAVSEQNKNEDQLVIRPRHPLDQPTPNYHQVTKIIRQNESEALPKLELLSLLKTLTRSDLTF